MAGIGDEIDPHRLEATRRCEIAKEQDHVGLSAPRPVRHGQCADLNLEGPFRRHTRRVERLQRGARAEHLFDPVQYVWGSQGEGKRVLDLQCRQQRTRSRIDFDDHAAPIHEDHRIGDVRQQGFGDGMPLASGSLRESDCSGPAQTAGKATGGDGSRPKGDGNDIEITFEGRGRGRDRNGDPCADPGRSSRAPGHRLAFQDWRHCLGLVRR